MTAKEYNFDLGTGYLQFCTQSTYQAYEYRKTLLWEHIRPLAVWRSYPPSLFNAVCHILPEWLAYVRLGTAIASKKVECQALVEIASPVPVEVQLFHSALTYTIVWRVEPNHVGVAVNLQLWRIQQT